MTECVYCLALAHGRAYDMESGDSVPSCGRVGCGINFKPDAAA